jgi:hypothetical protein
MLFEARTTRRSGPIDAASLDPRPSADGRECRAHAQPIELDRVPSYWGIGLTDATGRGQFAPQAAAPYSYKLATVVRAPSGPRIGVVAITAFYYGANYDPAVYKSDSDLLAHEFPHARNHDIAQNAPTTFTPRLVVAFAGRAC